MRKKICFLLILVLILASVVCLVNNYERCGAYCYGCRWVIRLKDFFKSKVVRANYSPKINDQDSKWIFTKEQELAIENIIKQYFRKNPKILLELEDLLQQAKVQEDVAQMLRTQQKIPKVLDNLLDSNNFGAVALGEDKDLVLIEFTQPLCPSCRNTFVLLHRFLAKNPRVQHIIFCWPFFGGKSVFLSKIILAAKWQNKVKEVYQAIWQETHDGYEEGQLLAKIKQISGLDCERLLKDQNRKVVLDAIKNNFHVAKQLEFLGTPTLILVNRKNRKFQLIANDLASLEKELSNSLQKVK